jgi:hypothetical protein
MEASQRVPVPAATPSRHRSVAMIDERGARLKIVKAKRRQLRRRQIMLTTSRH